MKREQESPDRFYSSIATVKKYTQEAERFVPGYREIINETINNIHNSPALIEHQPIKIIDLGSGPGHISLDILKELGESVSQVYCVDSELSMVEAARDTLSQYDNKTKFSEQNALEFSPEEIVDVVFSNLMLHNLPLQDKIELVGKIYDWLKPRGRFIWVDFVKFVDKDLWNKEMEYRKKTALKKGANPQFVRQNFYKERNNDYPITPEEMKEIMKHSGFTQIKEVWKKSTFSMLIGDK